MQKETNLNEFEQKIGITFKNKDLLLQAFTHRSYLNEHPESKIRDNERLEFLGDAVLELATTTFLYDRFTDKAEGELTGLRAALVNTRQLAVCARELGLNDYLRLSRGEMKDEGRARDVILANAFEALLGAIYLDQGYEVVRDFTAAEIFGRIDDIVTRGLWLDPNSRFQERAQEILGLTPSYRVLRESGPDHSKQFTVGLFIGEEEVAQGIGSSKQEAEEYAAREGLGRRGWA